MSPAAVAVSVGLVAGVVLAVLGAPRMRRPRLAARLDPYLRGLEPATTRLLQGAETPLTPLPALERLLGPLLQDGAAWSSDGSAGPRPSPAGCARPGSPPT
jgi:hypothetical protein